MLSKKQWKEKGNCEKRRAEDWTEARVAGPGQGGHASLGTQQPQWEAWERAQDFVVAESGLVFISVVNTF